MISQSPSRCPCARQGAHSSRQVRHIWMTFIVVLVASLANSTSVSSTIFVMPTDEELFDKSQFVVLATIEARQRDSSPLTPSTMYVFSVERVLKGVLGKHEIHVMVPGGLTENGLFKIVEGSSNFTLGDRAILFLTATDDALRITDMELGAFVERTSGAGSLALRTITATEFVRHSDPLAEARQRSHQLRDFDTFANWILDRARGTQRTPDYFLQQEPTLQFSNQAFTNITFSCQGGPAIARWAEFDSGVPVDVEMWEVGQPGVVNGGFQQLQNGLNAWSEVPAASVFLRYAGTTPDNAGGSFPIIDRINRVVPEDPNDVIAGTFDGSGFVTVSLVVADCGNTAEFSHGVYAPIIDVDIIGQDGVAASFLPGTLDPSLAWERIIAHELGHFIGIGDSCQDDCSGVAAEAIMRGNYVDSLLGSSLGIDDENAALFTYPGSLREVPSTGLAGLFVLSGLLILLALSVLRTSPGG